MLCHYNLNREINMWEGGLMWGRAVCFTLFLLARFIRNRLDHLDLVIYACFAILHIFVNSSMFASF